MTFPNHDLNTSDGVAYFADELLNLICKTVQDRIGQTAGDWASMYWSGRRGEEMENDLIYYINGEVAKKQQEDQHE